MAFFVNRQITKGMNSGSEDNASGYADMLGIGRGELGIGRDMLGINRDMLGSRTCRNNNPHRGRKYLRLWG